MWYIGQSLIAMNHRSCLLRWGASSDPDFAGFNIYMSTDPLNGFDKVHSGLYTDIIWLSPPLRPDTVYYFYITVEDIHGNESAESNTIEFKPDPSSRETEVVIVPPAEEISLISGTNFDDKPYTKDLLTKFELLM